MWSSAAVDHLLQGSTCCAFRDGILHTLVVTSGYLSYCCLSIISSLVCPFSSDINKAFSSTQLLLTGCFLLLRPGVPNKVAGECIKRDLVKIVGIKHTTSPSQTTLEHTIQHSMRSRTSLQMSKTFMSDLPKQQTSYNEYNMMWTKVLICNLNTNKCNCNTC